LKTAIEEKPPHNYFVYYDEWTGEIQQITNRQKNSKWPFIKTRDEVASKLLMGVLNISKFQVAELLEGPVLLPKSDVVRIKRAEEVLSSVPFAKPDTLSDINIILYKQDWKMEVNFSQDTLYRMTGKRYSNQTVINPELGGEYDKIQLFLIKDNDPTYLINTIEIDPVDLISSGFKVFELDNLRNVCALGDVRVLTKRIFKSYGLKHKDYFTGGEFHKRKSIKRQHKHVDFAGDHPTFIISPTNTGYIIKSNFQNPDEYKLFNDLTLYFTSDDPNSFLGKIKIPKTIIGWEQEFHCDDIPFDLKSSRILLGENGKHLTFKYEEL